MWLCILDIINATLGRLFLELIVEGKSHPMDCLGRRNGEGEL
jgi:hypothetical protein